MRVWEHTNRQMYILYSGFDHTTIQVVLHTCMFDGGYECGNIMYPAMVKRHLLTIFTLLRAYI